MKIFNILAVLLLLVACDQRTDLTDLTVTTQNGVVKYRVETAQTHEELAKGLMDRKNLDKNSGMIFDLSEQCHVAMWMQDTYIPLDMLFVSQDGRICWLYENAEPMSTKLIRPECEDKIVAVVELNAGDVKKHSMKVGDEVSHSFIKK